MAKQKKAIWKAVSAPATLGEPKRFSLLCDDDGHWYIVPKELKEKFDKWVEWTQEDSSREDGEQSFPNFDSMRINGSPTNISFTDPKEDW